MASDVAAVFAAVLVVMEFDADEPADDGVVELVWNVNPAVDAAVVDAF